MTFHGREELEERYSIIHPKLESIAERIQQDIEEVLDGVERIDSIGARAKSIESFEKKSNKLNNEGEIKYANPLLDIQDQVGARVVTFYKSDVPFVRRKILKFFRKQEDLLKLQDHPSKFGYESRHIICKIPPEILAEYKPHIKVFELQICTLFQHAWAEANHDIVYKANEELDDDDKRLAAFAASQAWGADKAFEELLLKIYLKNTKLGVLQKIGMIVMDPYNWTLIRASLGGCFHRMGYPPGGFKFQRSEISQR